MNSAAKGGALERRLVKQLEGMGFICEKARPIYKKLPSGKIIAVQHDFFTAFDGVAKRRGDRTVWFQVTTKNSTIANKAGKMVEALEHFDPAHDDVWIVRWFEPKKPGQRGEWRINRWDDMFSPKHTYVLTSNGVALPWEDGNEE